MSEPELQFLYVGQGATVRSIAYLKQPGQAPGLIWLQGLKSDMVSTKATAVQSWAADCGAGLVRFDYSGHGRSSGRFDEGTVGKWLEESEAVFRQLTAGPQVVIGSSMGGYLALLLLRRLQRAGPAEAQRIKAMVLIAPAWDMTEELMWKAFTPDVREAIERDGVWMRPSEYGAPYAITRSLIEEGRQHLLARQRWRISCPVTILQGKADPDVPLEHVRELMLFLDDGQAGQSLELVEVPQGDHRLSRPQDIALLLDIIKRSRA